jgi:hypothetical protein
MKNSTMPNRHKHPTIRLASKVSNRLSQPSGAIASVNLGRYFWLLGQSLPDFSEAEWNLLRDACNGWATTSEPPEILVQGLKLQVADVIANDFLDSKWQVDKDMLAEKLHKLTPLQAIAVVESIERWWARS